NFTGTSWVTFTGDPCGITPNPFCGNGAPYQGICDSQLTVTVPSYAQTGPIYVYNTKGSATSSTSFTGGGSAPAVVQVQNNIDVSGTFFTSFSVPITTQPGDLLVAFARESSNAT